MLSRLSCLLLLAALGCGGSPRPQDSPRHLPQRFEDLAPPPVQDAPLATNDSGEPGALQDERDVPLYDEWGGILEAPTLVPGEEADPLQPQPEAFLAIQPGEQVARLELTAPLRRTFVLRATLPVPEEYRLPAPGRSNLLILNRAVEELVPAQIEVVTRSPLGRPEVIEILAVVGLHPDDLPGSRVTFDVMLGDKVLARTPQTTPEVRRLLDPKGDGIQLRTRDVFGNEYEVDLLGRPRSKGSGSVRLLRQGGVARQRRVYGTLVPTVTGDKGQPLPHLMGVHAYITEWSGDERISLDLRINNGATAASGPASPELLPAGLLYWDSLDLILPNGWKIEALAPDPFLGEPRRQQGRTHVPIVRALEDGKMHMMGPQAQFHRRLTIVPSRLAGGQPDRPALEGLAFPIAGPGWWSWFHSRTSHFLPQKALLPTWEAYRYENQRGAAALRTRLRAEREHLAELLLTGSPDGDQVVGRVMGWAHPWFVNLPNGTGTVGLTPFQGHRVAAAGSRAGYEKLMFLHRMNASRQPDVQVNAEGDPITVEDWLTPGGRIPFDFRRNARLVPKEFRLPSLGGPTPSFHVAEVHTRKLRPPYDTSDAFRRGGGVKPSDDELLSWMPHDGQYMGRYTKFPQALVWLGNDALAKDDLIQAASLFRLQFHGHPHAAESWSEGVTLAVKEAIVRDYPHHGLDLDRDHAWGIDVACAAFAIANDEWRRGHEEWFQRVSDLFLQASMPSGIVQRRNTPGVLGGRYDACQTYQLALLTHAVRCLNESVLAGMDESRRARLELDQIRKAEYLFLGDVWLRLARNGPARNGEVEAGPRHAFAVAPSNDFSIPSYSDSAHWGDHVLPEDGVSPNVEWWAIWSAIEYAALLDDPSGREGFDNRFIRRAAAAWFAPGSLPALVERMYREAGRASNDNSGNWAGLVARLQELSK